MSLILDGTTGVPVTTVTGTLPVANGGTGVTTSTGTGAGVHATSPTIASPAISSAVMTTMASSVLTSGTAQASTSGTSIDFTGIPSWVKRITVMFNGVSTNGTAHYQIQIGTSGTPQTSGYAGNFLLAGPSVAGVANITSGFGVYNDSAADVINGQAVLSLLNASTNAWVLSGLFGRSSNTYTCISAGSVSLSGTLNILRITTVTGTPTFDAGSINILYE